MISVNPSPYRYVQSCNEASSADQSQDSGVKVPGVEVNERRREELRARLDQLIRRKIEREGTTAYGDTENDISFDTEQYSREGSLKPAQVEVCSLPYLNQDTLAGGEEYIIAQTATEHAAVKRHCCRALEEAIRGCDSNPVTTYNSHGRFPIHSAAVHGHLGCVVELFEKGATANCFEYSTYQRTPLFLACASGNLEIVQHLLAVDSNVNCVDARGDTPLHAACYTGNLCLIRILLENMANPNVANAKGHLPAHLCCTEEGLHLLYQYNGDLTTPDKRKRTPLFHACAKQRPDCISFLCSLEEASTFIHTSDVHGDMPLHACVSTSSENSVRCVEVLIQYGVDPLARNNQGYLASDISNYYSTAESTEILQNYELSYLSLNTEEEGLPSINCTRTENANSRADLSELANSLRLNRNYSSLADQYDAQSPYRQLQATTIICVVCQHNTVDMICLPCEHKSICNDCIVLHGIGGNHRPSVSEDIPQIRKCPVCRERISKIAPVTSSDDLGHLRWYGNSMILPSGFLSKWRNNVSRLEALERK